MRPDLKTHWRECRSRRQHCSLLSVLELLLISETASRLLLVGSAEGLGLLVDVLT